MTIPTAWSERFYRVITGMLRGQRGADIELAHDAVVDCWLEAARKPEGFFQGSDNLLFWGLRVAPCRARDLWRREHRRRCLPLPRELPAVESGCLEWERDRELLLMCLARLPAEDRRLLEWAWWECLSDRAIAERLAGRSGDAARQAVRRHRRRAEQALVGLMRATAAEAADGDQPYALCV